MFISGILCTSRGSNVISGNKTKCYLTLKVSFTPDDNGSYSAKFVAEGTDIVARTYTLNPADSQNPASWFSATLTGLEPNEKYSCHVEVYKNQSTWIATSETVEVLTYPPIPEITGVDFISSEKNGCTYRVNTDTHLTSFGERNGCTFYLGYTTRDITDEKDFSDYDYEESFYDGSTFTFSGLSHETTYYFYIWSENDAFIFDKNKGYDIHSGGWYWYVTTPKYIPIEPWVWNNHQTINGQSGEATASETIQAYNAITNHDSIIKFSHKVWNDLCAKTLEIRKADKDISIEWKTSQDRYNFLSYNDTLMSENDTLVTAARFNSLRINIGSMVTLSGIPFPAVTNETIIYGQYFLTLAKGLNTAIDNL